MRDDFGLNASHFPRPQRVGMPLISGYLLAGILLGPDVLGLVSRPAVLTLHPLESACLAVIAVAAGSEMRVVRLGTALQSRAAHAVPHPISCSSLRAGRP